MSKKLQFEEYIKKVTENANVDRAQAGIIIIDLLAYLKKDLDPARYKDNGMVLAKLIESSQRSNEQLLKIAKMLQELEEDSELSEEEKEALFDELNEKE